MVTPLSTADYDVMIRNLNNEGADALASKGLLLAAQAFNVAKDTDRHCSERHVQ